MPTVRSARALFAALAAAALLAGCGGGGSDAADPAADTTAAAKDTQGTDDAGADATAADEADPAGADEVADLMADYLETSRATLSTIDSTSTTAAVQASFRELRDALFETDGDLREIEIADPDLADTVDDFFTAARGSIGVFDEITTATPESLGQQQANAGNQAALDALGAAITAREAAIELAANGAVPDEPSASEVLAVPDDFAPVGGQPAYAMKPEGELQPPASGPCGKPPAIVQVPPRTIAAAYLEDAQVSAIQRVLVFDDGDEATAYVDAIGEAFSCDQPEGYRSAKVEALEEGDGIRIQSVDDDSYVSTLLVVPDGNRVVTVDVLGDQVQGAPPLEVTRTHAETILSVIEDRANS